MTNLDFDAFFLAVHGYDPFPWQSRLARTLCETDTWPDLIDLPTASGKTACIDIAIFHLAVNAAKETPWLAARRIAFVVDRRIIVDSAFERAETIRNALLDSSEPAVRAVADALTQLGGDAPLLCHKLRGGVPRERGFAFDPTQAMVITSTIDQIGSRLLFRGYGLTRYAQPMHAGLLGHDTLVLLDEAHLGQAFSANLSAIRQEQARAETALPQVQPVRLVSLSATASVQGASFRLDADDLANTHIAARRSAPKPVRLVESPAKLAERVKLLAQEALHLYEELNTQVPIVAVIVNRVSLARAIFEQLKTAKRTNFDVELMVGRSRPLDRDAVSSRVLSRAGSGRKPDAQNRGLIVVATQTIEVGADLDFHGLVTECASLDALRQRFGRLDRLGQFRRSLAVIAGGHEPTDDPIYGAAAKSTWEWLNTLEAVDFSIASLDTILADLDAQPLTIAPPSYLQLTPAHVESLCQTDPPPTSQPEVSSLLHACDSGPADVQIVWRNGLPALVDDRSIKLVNILLDYCPPSSLETLSISITSAKSWLGNGKAAVDEFEIEGRTRGGEASSEVSHSPLVWRRSLESWEAVPPLAIRPGDTLVVPSIFGGCDEFGFSASSTEPVRDLYRESRTLLQKERIEFITQDQLKTHFTPALVTAAWKKIDVPHAETSGAPSELFQTLSQELGSELLRVLGWSEQPIIEVLLDEDRLHALTLRDGKPGIEDISDEDLSSSRTVPVPLDEHNAGVARTAARFAKSLGLGEAMCQLLHRAGNTHDLGKADPRFQRMLRAGDDSTLANRLLAKGRRQGHSARVELGERHEAYSVALLKLYPELLSDLHDPELALYLVGTHHGRGRSLMPDRADDGTIIDVEYGEVTLHLDDVPHLGVLGSGWPTLFWRLTRRYGPWGLAYLEAVLRLADHIQSREEIRPGVRS
ncbi:MAG: type I-U CRISPR-associated helicase/endonuclease Cas3 [Pseudomonadota bacterium]|nr:type I-U CRISPR-associated helicase/endonuclease Cas3 [Pseudomonadota bacterium]